MPSHKHADLMLQYAQDAQETDTPWERWEVNAGLGWDARQSPIQFFHEHEYRRKPETIDINGFKVPKPMRIAPPVGTPFFYVEIFSEDIFIRSRWGGRDWDRRLLSRGLCHLTEAAAIKHAEALLSFTKVQE
jgi:hypothetical protein